MELCYLDRDDIPPIGELEHIEKRCFCYLCSCGKHSCPSVASYIKPSVKATSSYREKFTRKRAMPSKPFKFLGEMQLSKQKMDLISSNQASFKPILEEIDRESQKPHRRSTSPYKFYGNSTYQTNYIKFDVMRQARAEVNSSGFSPLKFVAKSTYADEYIKHGKLPDNFERVIKNENILGKGEFTLLDTTNSRTYVHHKNRLRSLPYRHSSMDFNSFDYASPHFKTTYSDNFSSPSPNKNFRPTLKQLVTNK